MRLDSNTITSTFWTIIAMMFVYVGLGTLDIITLPEEIVVKCLFAGTLFFIGTSIFTECTRWGRGY